MESTLDPNLKHILLSRMLEQLFDVRAMDDKFESRIYELGVKNGRACGEPHTCFRLGKHVYGDTAYRRKRIPLPRPIPSLVRGLQPELVELLAEVEAYKRDKTICREVLINILNISDCPNDYQALLPDALYGVVEEHRVYFKDSPSIGVPALMQFKENQKDNLKVLKIRLMSRFIKQ